MDTNAENSKEWAVRITAQGQFLKMELPTQPPRGGGGARSRISTFSAQSRKRMLDKLAQIEFKDAGFIAFVTLTYPDRDGPPSSAHTSRDLDVFLKRIRRRYPDASAIWRREWEERKSGAHEGVSYPHYHFLFFNLPFVHFEKINEWWGDVLVYVGDLRTEIKGIQDWRQAGFYVSKYMAKVERSDVCCDDREAEDDEDQNEELCKWLSTLDENAAPEAILGDGEADACSLVNVTYLTANDDSKGDEHIPENNASGDASKDIDGESGTKSGRHWGVFNQKKIPFAEMKTITIRPGAWLKEFRNEAGKVWPLAGEENGFGFTLFVEDAEQWLDLARRLEEGEQP